MNELILKAKKIIGEKIKNSASGVVFIEFNEISTIIPSSKNSGIQFNEPDMDHIREVCRLLDLNLEIHESTERQLPIYKFSKIQNP